MSHTDVSRFVTLALDDENLRRELEREPDRAFQGFTLTPEERQAISSADEHALRSLGLDPMTARSWAAFHNVEGFAPDRPDAPGDLPPRSP
jgi:hypothetical protein